MPPVAVATTTAQFRQLVRRQDDVLSRRQLRSLGVTRQHVARRVRAGGWQAVGPHVIVLHDGPFSERQQLWVALLHGGKDAALGALTAATADGLVGFQSAAHHVLVPHGRNREDLDHPKVRVKVHESRQLGESDVHPARTPRRTRLARSVIDAASMAHTDGRCRAILASAVQQRLVRPEELSAIARSRRSLPRRALILETISDVEGGSHSLPELELLRGFRRVGLPLPDRQRLVQRGDGRYYLDADFDQFAVTIEVNGAQHIELLLKEADDLRRTRLATGGRLVVDLGSYTVRHDNDLAMLIVADALLSRGWPPDAPVRQRLQSLAHKRASWAWTTAAIEQAAGGPTGGRTGA